MQLVRFSDKKSHALSVVVGHIRMSNTKSIAVDTSGSLAVVATKMGKREA